MGTIIDFRPKNATDAGKTGSQKDPDRLTFITFIGVALLAALRDSGGVLPDAYLYDACGSQGLTPSEAGRLVKSLVDGGFVTRAGAASVAITDQGVRGVESFERMGA
jgi:hypothetical protein